MSDDVGDIAAFYSSDPEREHERLEQHQLEHELTLWLDLLEEISTESSIIGASRHLLYIGTKVQ